MPSSACKKKIQQSLNNFTFIVRSYDSTIDNLISFADIYFCQCDCDHRDLHSFPTRRSSDLTSSSTVRSTPQSSTPRGAKPRSSSCSSASRPEPCTERWRRSVRRSEEHTSELQSPCNLVCRLLLVKKKYSNR